MNASKPPALNETNWEAWLVRGRPPLQVTHTILRGVLGRLPGFPRCKLCNRPLGGPFGTPLTLIGFGASRKNPSLCSFCVERLPLGGAEVDVAVLFADVRGSTALAEGSSAATFAALMNRFYRVATDALLAHGAVVDKLVGDEVVALFLPGLSGPQYRQLAARAGLALLPALGYGTAAGPWLGLGIGVHAGVAFVGNVGTEGVSDFTALGDTVNIAARLQGTAQAGEVVMSEDVYRNVSNDYPGPALRTVMLQGRTEPVAIRVLDVAAVAKGVAR